MTHLVAIPTPLRARETPAQAAQRAQAQAVALADGVYVAALDALERAAQACADVNSLDSIPAGIREEARQLITHIEARVMSMTALKSRPSQ